NEGRGWKPCAGDSPGGVIAGSAFAAGAVADQSLTPKSSRRIAPPAASSIRHCRSDLVRELDDEVVAVRHLLLRQRLRVHGVAFADDLVAGEDEGGERVALVVLQRARARPGHRAPDVVEQRRGIGPEVLDRLESLDATTFERQV